MSVKLPFFFYENPNWVNLKKKREEAISEKNQILAKDPEAFKGNTLKVKEHKEFLLKTLGGPNDFQKAILLGLILSDSSYQLNNNMSSIRFKIQQSYSSPAEEGQNFKPSANHGFFLHHLSDVFYEWTASTGPLIFGKRKMGELISLQTVAFIEPAELVSDKATWKPGGVVKKTMQKQQELYQNLSSVAVAYWFMGDGGLSDKEGRGVLFNTQGFTKQDVEILADILKNKFNYDATVKQESKKGMKIEQYFIRISGKSFDQLFRDIGPYLLNDFKYKVPNFRKEGSHHGDLYEKEYEILYGSAAKDPDFMYKYQNNP